MTNTTMNEQEANAKIADLIKQAENLLDQAASIANEHELSFSWNGPEYGMGGRYSSGEWQASSTSC